MTRQGEQRAFRDLGAPGKGVAAALRARYKLVALREQQRTRDSYLAAYPDELDLGPALQRLFRDDDRRRRPGFDPTNATTTDGGVLPAVAGRTKADGRTIMP